MKIKGVDGLSAELIRDEINRGARLVMYTYCVSIIVLTFKRPSDIYLVRAGQSRVVKGLPFTLLSLVMGWWGFPWGPIYTIESLIRNFSGGSDLTDEVMGALLPANIPPPLPTSAARPYSAPASPHRSPLALTGRQISIGLGAIAAIGVLIYAGICAHLGGNAQVVLLSGLQKTYTVQLNGQPITLPSRGTVKIEHPEGTLTVTGIPNRKEPIELEFTTPFWSRPFDRSILVLNPDQLALFYDEDVVYYSEKSGAASTAKPPPITLYANQAHYRFAKPDYLFEVPPQNIQMPAKTEKLARTALHQFIPQDAANAVAIIEQHLGAEAASQHARLLAQNYPDSEDCIEILATTLKPEESLAFLEARLDERPLHLAWHRMYQNIVGYYRPNIDLAVRYEALADAEPANGTLRYLHARMVSHHEKAVALMEQSLKAPEPCTYAHIGLGFAKLSAGQFQEALACYDRAAAAGLDGKNLRSARRDALLALRQYKPALDAVLAESVKSPFDIELAAEEIRLRILLKTDPAEITQTIETLHGNFSRGTDVAKALKLRAYLDAAAAYAQGSEKKAAGYLRTVGGPLNSFQAAISERKHLAAHKALRDEPRLFSQHYLALFLTASLNSDAENAESYWRSAVDAMQHEHDSIKLLGRHLDGKTPLSPEQICNLSIRTEEKCFILAALALRDPEHRPLYKACALKHNFLPKFPQLLIADVLNTL